MPRHEPDASSSNRKARPAAAADAMSIWYSHRAPARRAFQYRARARRRNPGLSPPSETKPYPAAVSRSGWPVQRSLRNLATPVEADRARSARHPGRDPEFSGRKIPLPGQVADRLVARTQRLVNWPPISRRCDSGSACVKPSRANSKILNNQRPRTLRGRGPTRVAIATSRFQPLAVDTCVGLLAPCA